MQPTPTGIRIVGAFLAGIVLALGAALIYTRTSSMLHPQTQVPPATTAAPMSQDLQPALPSPPESVPLAGQGEKTAATDLPEVTSPRVPLVPKAATRAAKVKQAKPRRERPEVARITVSAPSTATSVTPPSQDPFANANPAQPARQVAQSSPPPATMPAPSAPVNEPRQMPTPAPRNR